MLRQPGVSGPVEGIIVFIMREELSKDIGTREIEESVKIMFLKTEKTFKGKRHPSI